MSRLTSDGRTVTVPAGADVDIGTWRIVSREPATGMVGMHIEQPEGRLYVKRVLVGMHAMAAGLHGGEEIASIEGIRGTELSESEGRALIRGAPGTGVTLEIAPASGGAARTVVIVRVEAKDED